jgi:hypothetical protein
MRPYIWLYTLYMWLYALRVHMRPPLSDHLHRGCDSLAAKLARLLSSELGHIVYFENKIGVGMYVFAPANRPLLLSLPPYFGSCILHRSLSRSRCIADGLGLEGVCNKRHGITARRT